MLLGRLVHVRHLEHCHDSFADQSSGNAQAKTTKKIVLRLQCSVCKYTHMHPIKVRRRTFDT